MRNNENKKEAKQSLISVLVREFWGLTKLNFCFVVFSLPVFTIGASLAAMHRVTKDMANDIPTDPIYDFRRYFKAAFSRTIGVFFAVLFSIAASLFSAFVYFYSAAESKSMILYLPAAAALIFFVFMLCISPYIFRIPELTAPGADIKKEDIRLKKLVYKAFAVSALNLKKTVISALLLFLVLYILVGYFPYSVPLFLFYGNAFFSVWISYIHRSTEFDLNSYGLGGEQDTKDRSDDK